MQSNLSRISLAALVVLLTLTTLTAHAQYTESVLYNFDANGNDEAFPWGNLVSDASGNLFGATEQGGANGYGSIFEASPSSTGWNVTELYSFTIGNDGGFPKSGVIFDAAGNLYGTTYGGGSANYGTVWELSPSSGGTWTLTTLHTFLGPPDAGNSISGLVFDKSGNLYGAAAQGGVEGNGAIFELTHSSSGWTEQVIYSFTAAADGELPSGNLVIDAAGNLYGTAEEGGSKIGSLCAGFNGCGTVFRLSPGATWKFTTLLEFNGTRGAFPYAGVTLDTAGNLYGTTFLGGACKANAEGCGTVFKLTPTLRGPWKQTVLHVFKSFSDGEQPFTNLTFDAAGNLFGTSLAGSSVQCGAVWELKPSGTGWTFTSLTIFPGSNNAVSPTSAILIDASGNLLGVSEAGGTGTGTLYELSPTIAR
jgi:uncharacterized repeat protein (TIGR03803 family)